MTPEEQRMCDYLTTQLAVTLGPFVNELVTPESTKRMREALVAQLEKFVATIPVEIVCDDSNNTSTSIKAGFINFGFRHKVSGESLSEEEVYAMLEGVYGK
jgi:hypothetical protein